MAKYTEQLDAQIAQLLQTRGQVSAEMLTGVTEEEARSFLGFYVSTHPEVDVVFDDGVLQPLPAHVPAAVEPQAEVVPETAVGEAAGLAAVAAARTPAPDETPGYRGSARGTYDPYDGIQPIPEARTYPVSKWLWLLPLFFGLPGGIVGWLLARDRNPSAARTMIVVGTMVMVSSACIGFSMGGVLGGAGSGATDMAWPVTATTTFYYFGTPD